MASAGRRRGARVGRKAGLPPGSIVYTGDQKLGKVTIEIFDYDESGLREVRPESVEECFPFKDTPTVTWMNVIGLHDVALIEKLGTHFDLHPLLMEDIVSVNQRPKYEDFGSYLFVVMRMLHYGDEPGCDELRGGGSQEVTTEQVSLIIGENFVISFQEIEADPFEHVRQRLRASQGRVRSMGADYLAYALIDAVVDYYFVVLEKLGDGIESLEEQTVTEPNPGTLGKIQSFRRDLGYVRRSIWPLREVVGALERAESPLIREDTGVYLRDVYDHTIQVVETVESFRDMVSGMFDTYLSSVSNRMNEVMKVLTIIATIFIPVTFISGVYGMNFQYMPELGWRWAYPVVLLLMLAVGIGMLAYFKRKRWL
jgi:magnesium transporter